jgi:hypothetical protein
MRFAAVEAAEDETVPGCGGFMTLLLGLDVVNTGEGNTKTPEWHPRTEHYSCARETGLHNTTSVIVSGYQ